MEIGGGCDSGSGDAGFNLQDCFTIEGRQKQLSFSVGNIPKSDTLANLSTQAKSPPPTANEIQDSDSPQSLHFLGLSHSYTYTTISSRAMATSTSLCSSRSYDVQSSNSPMTPLAHSILHPSGSQGYLYPPIPSPPLHNIWTKDSKGGADRTSSRSGNGSSRSSSAISSHGHYNMNDSKEAALLRHTASSPVVSPTDIGYSVRYANSAGASLPHVPRRKSGAASRAASTFCLTEEISPSPSTSAEVGSLQVTAHTPEKGRPNSRFVIGGESTSDSSSGSEDELCVLRESVAELINNGDQGQNQSCHSESESECTTPTASYTPKKQDASLSMLEAAIDIMKSEVSPAGISSPKFRGRTEVQKRLSLEGSSSGSNNGKSTIVFPSSKPYMDLAPESSTPSQPLHPHLTVNTNVSKSSTLKDKRQNAGSLHLDLSLPNSAPLAIDSNQDSEASFLTPRPKSGYALSESASLNDVPLIRKKSGEVVRPSLKSRSASASRHRPCLSMSDLSDIPMASPSASAPATPSASVVKMVHFDSKLEHVKLFLSEQKPAAVSRDGSPTSDGDTTSGGEDSDHALATPTKESTRSRRLQSDLVPHGDENTRPLILRVINMPPHNFEMHEGINVRLEGLHLSEDARRVQGTVRVRNIEFEKKVAVRFTLDGWQTTSEVLGRWIESIPMFTTSQDAISSLLGPAYDRFAFSISLADILRRLEEKTLVLAVKYVTGNQEYWDNNNGENYRAIFERRSSFATHAIQTSIRIGSDHSRGTNLSSKTTNNRGLGLSLQSALEKVVNDDSGKTDDAPTFGSPAKHSDSLAGRYDLAQSLRNVSLARPPAMPSHTWYSGFKPSSSRNSPVQSTTRNFSTTNKTVHQGLYNNKFDVFERGRAGPDSNQWFQKPRFDILQGNQENIFNNLPTHKEDTFSRLLNMRSEYELGLERVKPSPGLGFAPLCQKQERNHVRNHHRSSYFDSMAAVTGFMYGAGKARTEG